MRTEFVSFCLLALVIGSPFGSAGYLHPVTSINESDKKPEVPSDKDVQAEQLFWDQFLKGLYASLYVIVISELGDKTFFIAAIMSMQHSRCLVYSGAMTALATMTILSAMLGYATTVIPRRLTYYTSGVLFFLFGLKMIYDASKMSPSDAQEEYEEVKQQLATTVDPELGKVDSSDQRIAFRTKLRTTVKRVLSPVFAEAFILTFLAEWGDRSQITTIVMAATKSASGVIVGGILGHMACTGLAVLMGRFIAQRIPVKWLTYIGGITFLLFGLLTFINHPEPST